MTYDFKCPQCNQKVEIKSNMKVISEKNFFCTECGRQLERIFSAPGIKFVGSGFYVNDYKEKK